MEQADQCTACAHGLRLLLFGIFFQTQGPTPEEPPHNDLDSVRTLLRKPMRYYITAGRQNEEVAADSTFATLLLRGLRGDADVYHEGIISAEELGIYLYHEVPRYSPRPQTPQFKGIGNARLSEGQFYFLAAPGASRRERRVVAYDDGDRYDGEFLDNMRNGHGVYTLADGARYDGEFRNDEMTGHGVFTIPDLGTRYEGEFRDGFYSGHGVLTYANGDRYDGEWRDDMENGHGLFTYANGDRYDGEFRDGKRNGHGIYTYANGDRYDGEFRDGKRNGHGIYTYADGRRDEGEWHDDKRM